MRLRTARVALSWLLALIIIVPLGSRVSGNASPVEQIPTSAVDQPVGQPAVAEAAMAAVAESSAATEVRAPQKWAPDPGTRETAIGYSQGGRPLTVYHRGGGPDSVLILGGQHGGPEANTVRLAWQLLDYFDRRPEEIPASLRLDFLPETNPDGLAIGSRQFLSGVDPNRNWPGRNWSPDAADSNGVFRRGLGGPEPFSEPETQALRDFIIASRPLMTVNYHSRGGFLFGGGRFAEAYSAASGYYRPGVGGGPAGGGAGSLLGYSATGSMNVWMGQESFPAMLIELATSFDSEFTRNLPALQAILTMVGESA